MPDRPRIGAPCPAFSVVDTHGDVITDQDLRGGPTLLIFYPFAFTPICDAELSDLEGRIGEFDDVAVLAVSCDPPAAVRAWQEHKDFSFAMASDFWPHGAAATAFGAFDSSTGHATRSSFVLDPAGRVSWSVRNPAGVGRSVEGYLEALAPFRDRKGTSP